MPRRFVGLYIAIIVVAVLGIPIVVSALVTKSAAQVAYERQLAACERGQPLRVVQYGNTLSAINTTEKIGDYANEGGFWVSKAILLSTPGIDPETGAIDCEAVVEKP